MPHFEFIFGENMGFFIGILMGLAIVYYLTNQFNPLNYFFNNKTRANLVALVGFSASLPPINISPCDDFLGFVIIKLVFICIGVIVGIVISVLMKLK